MSAAVVHTTLYNVEILMYARFLTIIIHEFYTSSDVVGIHEYNH